MHIKACYMCCRWLSDMKFGKVDWQVFFFIPDVRINLKIPRKSNSLHLNWFRNGRRPETFFTDVNKVTEAILKIKKFYTNTVFSISILSGSAAINES